MGKIRLKLQFYFNITDINISAGHHIKTLKPNIVPSASVFIPSSKIYKSSKNLPKRRSPRKRHLWFSDVFRGYRNVTLD